ncbi:MAG TPA: ADP-ribosylglycohydrolase family protein [Chthonomonadaceae bacterium]|nr:ADP-ribosylglycohydrolase family protein [Chthonomonadaceae bacterium]
MKQIWLYLSKSDIETERRQCEEEGRDLSGMEEDFARVLSLDLEDLKHQPAARGLLDKTIALPIKADYAFCEPSDLEGIRAARPAARPQLPALSLNDAQLEDKVYGAWVGRCVGCLLGKPVEGWRRPRMWGYLKDLNRWPLSDFFRYDVATPEAREKYDLDSEWVRRMMADQVTAMPEDDDTNYTTTGLAILKRYGPDFTPEDVASFWMSDIPILHTCTAERVAYRNLCLLIPPPKSASFHNPYREWIGAQIRADFWGYAAPGDPERAAEFAWRDACISHVKNGIYGEMWAAAMIAAAFVTDDIPTILRAGLAQIPAKCRLADAIESVMEWQEVGVDYDTAVYRLHELWDENRAHDWCHTISNAMAVAIALLWGEGDYATTICRAVQPCFDTDCNGATTGSLLGILTGRKALPARWVDIINDTLHTGVTGYHTVKLADITRDSLEIIEKVAR